MKERLQKILSARGVASRRKAEELMEQLHCEGYIYEGKGHGVYDEAPDYQTRIREFLKEVK